MDSRPGMDSLVGQPHTRSDTQDRAVAHASGAVLRQIRSCVKYQIASSAFAPRTLHSAPLPQPRAGQL
jgi:hypothetical protein